MFGKNISGPRLKAMVWLSTALYIILALLYFLPVELPYEITFPVTVIAIFSLWLVPLPMSVALIASAAGDLMGTAGNFMAQMECFAVAKMRLVQQKPSGLTTLRGENAVSPAEHLRTNNVSGRKRG